MNCDSSYWTASMTAAMSGSSQSSKRLRLRCAAMHSTVQVVSKLNTTVLTVREGEALLHTL